jgi:hypothetical protein
MRVNAQKKAAQSPVSIVLQRDALPLTSKMVDGWEGWMMNYLLIYSTRVRTICLSGTMTASSLSTMNYLLSVKNPSSWLVRPLPEIRLPRTSNQNQSTDRRAPNGASAASTKSREWLLVSRVSTPKSPHLQASLSIRTKVCRSSSIRHNQLPPVSAR